jgi:hypothetical protein
LARKGGTGLEPRAPCPDVPVSARRSDRQLVMASSCSAFELPDHRFGTAREQSDRSTGILGFGRGSEPPTGCPLVTPTSLGFDAWLVHTRDEYLWHGIRRLRQRTSEERMRWTGLDGLDQARPPLFDATSNFGILRLPSLNRESQYRSVVSLALRDFGHRPAYGKQPM